MLTIGWSQIIVMPAFVLRLQVSFPHLESLTLYELPKVNEIWHDEPTLELFNNLRSLQISRCSFPMSGIKWNLLLKLANLESLTIERCQHVQEVFDLRGLKSGGNIGEVLPRLTEIELRDLPSLMCVCNENAKGILMLQNLTLLEVHACDNLRFLFPSSVAKALSRIRSIEVRQCKMMEEIILEEEGEEEVTCPALKWLLIVRCPKMKAFSSYSQNQEALMATNVDSGESSSKDDVKFPSTSFFNEKVCMIF